MCVCVCVCVLVSGDVALPGADLQLGGHNGRVVLIEQSVRCVSLCVCVVVSVSGDVEPIFSSEYIMAEWS